MSNPNYTQIETETNRLATKYGLDPNILMGIVRTETKLPQSIRAVDVNSSDWKGSLERGAIDLKGYMKEFKDTNTALGAFYQGSEITKIDGLNKESQSYASSVLKNSTIYQKAIAGLDWANKLPGEIAGKVVDNVTSGTIGLIEPWVKRGALAVLGGLLILIAVYVALNGGSKTVLQPITKFVK